MDDQTLVMTFDSEAKEEDLEINLDDLAGICRWILVNDQMQ